MLTGLYSAAAGLEAQQARLDILANDVSNVSTTGYRSGRMTFRDLVYQTDGSVRRGTGSAVDAAGRSFRQGAMLVTDRRLDVALEGPGFLQVTRADGTPALTRSGELRVDGDGSLVIPSGERLSPPITLPPGTDPADVTIASDGTVTVLGESAGQLAIVSVPAPHGLFALGDNLFQTTEASGATTEAERTLVRQGHLEASNVDLGVALVDVLEAQRAVELASRALRTQDQLLEMANGIRR